VIRIRGSPFSPANVLHVLYTTTLLIVPRVSSHKQARCVSPALSTGWTVECQQTSSRCPLTLHSSTKCVFVPGKQPLNSRPRVPDQCVCKSLTLVCVIFRDHFLPAEPNETQLPICRVMVAAKHFVHFRHSSEHQTFGNVDCMLAMLPY
jgi:hypothetical protein